MAEVNAERFWMGKAAKVVRRINVAWWLDRLNRLLVPVAVAVAGAILVIRERMESPPGMTEGLLAFGLGILLLAILSWFRARRHFLLAGDGIVRLDDQLGMRNRLVSAMNKVGTWPEPVRDTNPSAIATPDWRPLVALGPGLFGIALVISAWLVPLPQGRASDRSLVNEPAAWETMEDWLATLEEEELIEPEGLDELAEKIEDLREKPNEDWFSHTSLEATDSLRESLGRDIRDLATDLETLERDLQMLRSYSTELTEEGREMLLREYDEAMKGLEANGLELNRELLSQLKEIDPSELGQKQIADLTQEEFEALQDRLCEACNGLGSMEGLPSIEEGENLMIVERGMSLGSGEIKRGRGDAPMFFGDEQDIEDGRIESVTNKDLSRASIGDVVGVGETEHEDSPESKGSRTGGTVISTGKGGEAVWRESLLPDEKAVLKRYFQ